MCVRYSLYGHATAIIRLQYIAVICAHIIIRTIRSFIQMTTLVTPYVANVTLSEHHHWEADYSICCSMRGT